MLFFRGAVVSCVLAFALAGRAMGGVDPEANTDGFNPAAELSEIGEARRQEWIARQHGLNAAMIWSSNYSSGDLWGPPVGGPPIRQPIGYESKQVGPNRWIYRPLYAEEVAPAAVAPAPAARPPVSRLPSPAPSVPPVPARPGPSDPDAFDAPAAGGRGGKVRAF